MRNCLATVLPQYIQTKKETLKSLSSPPHQKKNNIHTQDRTRNHSLKSKNKMTKQPMRWAVFYLPKLRIIEFVHNIFLITLLAKEFILISNSQTSPLILICLTDKFALLIHGVLDRKIPTKTFKGWFQYRKK